MRIPGNPLLRDELYQTVINDCMASREDRIQDYEMLRAFFLFGSAPGNEPATYNKIYPSLDLLSSFLFASETTRFSIELGPSVPESELSKVPIMNDAIHDDWNRSNADMVFGMALLWSLVFSTTIIKLVRKRGMTNPFMVSPDSFGVLREDTPFLDRQEAFVHSYLVSRAELERQLDEHPKKDEILSYLSATPKHEGRPAGVDRLILTATSPNMVGVVQPIMSSWPQYRARVDDGSIEMQELWVWDDDLGDYRVVTRASNEVTVYDRKNFWIPNEHPFIQICPDPMPEYFWGQSQVARLVPLQIKREQRMQQIAELLEKQANPPTDLTGWVGLIDEKNFALNRAGGVLSTGEMTSKVNQHRPEIPADIFHEIKELDSMFAEETGLQNVLAGRGEVGVRSGRQTTELARLGSARIKKRSLIVEDALEKMATLYMMARQRYSDRPFLDTNGVKFIAKQFPDDFVVKVDAHSNSPIFVEDHKADAAELLQAKCIDRETYIDLVNPPMRPLIKQRLKKIKADEAKAQGMAMQMKQQEAAQKGGGKVSSIK